MRIRVNSGDRTTTLQMSKYEIDVTGILVIYKPYDDSVKLAEFKEWTEYEVLES